MRSAHKQAYKELDKPLYKDFVNAATGALADIRLDEMTTENIFRLEEHYEAQGFSRAEVREILKEYVSLGEFDHKGYHPVKGFVSGVLDVTIVKPVIEAITGRDMITHERLTDFERGMQGVDAVIGVITLGQGAVAAKVAGEGIFKTVIKTWAIDALSDTAAYTVGSICDENGVPLGITLVLSTLTGCSVSKKAGKYLLTDMASGAVTEYTAEEVQSLLREANVDGLAGESIEIFERMSKSGEEIIEGAKREKEALEAAVKGIKAADVTDTAKLAKAAGNINSLTNVVKAADGTNVVEKVLKKPLTEKKTLSEGLIAKAVGNINSIINAVKTGENSADAIQQAVNGIKTIDITGTIKQVEIPKKNTVNEVLSKNLEIDAAKNASGKATVIYGSDDIAKYQYNMIENPGPLAYINDRPAKNFYGGRYNAEVLMEDRIYYRAGNSEKALSQWFTTEIPESVAKVRIDTAVKPQWIDPATGVLTGKSVVDTVYVIKIPKGTTVYTGPVGPQGGAYCGGYDIMQTFIETPWEIDGVEVLEKIILK